MSNSIIVTVNLGGAIEGAVKSRHTQKHTVPLDGGKTATANILHTDRRDTECNRSFTVDGNVVHGWVVGSCPNWVNSGKWREMSPNRRIKAFIQCYDEGYGVSFETIDQPEKWSYESSKEAA